ncbi:MAG: D-alanyl-D-alanine carboxypeptidase family protein [Bacillota bacterium]|nr:D-alanyl-D-alanine carboxypeptidase family protein [Bacillota bacterium]
MRKSFKKGKEKALALALGLLLVLGTAPAADVFGGGVWAAGEEGALSPPEVSARTAVVIELNTGAVLYEKNMDEKVYPASTTKILTGLLAVESGDLQRQVKVSSNAAGKEGSSIYLAAGELLSMEDLLYGLMLRSGNDAAVAIAEGVDGTVEAFVESMNRRALELGAENTHFVNPNGLFDEEHYTTAYDMALIARAAMSNEAFRTVAGSREWTADRETGKYMQFYNKNKVVYEYDGGTGVKIGYTTASGRTLVASSQRNGMELICVVMDAPDWFQDSYALMDYVYENYTMQTVAEQGRILKAVTLRRGEKEFVYVGAAETAAVPVKRDGSSVVTIEYETGTRVPAPVSRWQEAGSLKVFSDGEQMLEAPLCYLEDVERREK